MPLAEEMFRITPLDLESQRHFLPSFPASLGKTTADDLKILLEI